MTKILEFHIEIPQRGWGLTGNSKIPSLRGVSETNDEAISFKIPSKISSLRGNKATEAISKNSIIHYRDPRVKPEDDIVRNSRIP